MSLFFHSYKILFAFLFLTIYQHGFCQSAFNEQERQLEQAVKNKDFSKAAQYSFELARQLRNEKQSDKAVEYLGDCITYSRKAKDDVQMQLAYYQLGLTHTDTKNYSKALDSFEKSLKLAKEVKKADAVNESLINIATSYAYLGRYKRTISPLEEALSLALRQNNLPLQQRCYELLASYYTSLGDKSKATEYQNLFNNLVKSMQIEEKTEEQLKALEQKIKHTSQEKNTVQSKLVEQSGKLKQTKDSLLAAKSTLEVTAQSLQEATAISEKRQLEIDLLSKDKELADMKIKEQHARLETESLIRYSTIAGLLMAAAFIALVVRSYRSQVDANKKIEKQNNNIKSSINYARRIQEAMLPEEALQKSLLPDSFILFKPRDSVSGDFYWFTEIKNWYSPDVVFAAADCTGHGVPGAFMSLIGMNALSGIIQRGIAEPNQILDALDSEIRTNLQQEVTGNNDGMDIALCIYRKEKSIIEFSGAKNPLIYIQNKQLFQVKGDVHAIGGHKRKKEFSYKKHTIVIDEPTTLYLFSDGFRDQFGDNNAGKFMSKKFNQLLLDIHQLPLQEQKELLDKTFEQWKGNAHQTDDVLVMGIKLEPTV